MEATIRFRVLASMMEDKGDGPVLYLLDCGRLTQHHETKKGRSGGSGVGPREGDTAVSSAHDSLFVLFLFHLHLSGTLFPDLSHVFLFLNPFFFSPSENKIFLCFGVHSLSLSRIKSLSLTPYCVPVFLLMILLFFFCSWSGHHSNHVHFVIVVVVSTVLYLFLLSGTASVGSGGLIENSCGFCFVCPVLSCVLLASTYCSLCR
ncbi:hypothetical protein B0J18DRAFT_198304 [Chaetomium sp. MPI-SDFR-AT-0129]|nr:hypothetical protein B0J18DRAFT_198304 [Chaetomium sp. MPI-SDFR-AT-0129]